MKTIKSKGLRINLDSWPHGVEVEVMSGENPDGYSWEDFSTRSSQSLGLGVLIEAGLRLKIYAALHEGTKFFYEPVDARRKRVWSRALRRAGWCVEETKTITYFWREV